MVEGLAAISGALTVLKDKIKASQKKTEEMIANGDFDLDDDQAVQDAAETQTRVTVK
jgi:hypothetical protein